MNEPTGNRFDKKGFVFSIKLILTVGLLVFSARFLTDGIMTYLGSVPDQTSSSQVAAAASTTELPKTFKPAPPRYITGKTIEESVPEEGKFIGANLDSMELFLYEDGELVKTYDILSKGRSGTRWDTPSGSYEILYKSPNHFSSISAVWMPYAMQFHGNFFIHGWPYYPDGTDVHPGFSGGCIRLSTPDSKEVYEFTTLNTPMYVYESYIEDVSDEEVDKLNTFAQDVKSELLKKIKRARGIEIGNAAPPRLSAASYLIADLNSGRVYAEKNADEVRPIASISKLMTALIANDAIHYDRLVTVTNSAASSYGNLAEFSAGEKVNVTDMMHALLLYSANDAAIAIGDYFGADNFKRMMNTQAQAIGMANSHFVEPSGLSSENVSTASDLFRLTQYIYQKKNYVFDITKENQRTITSTLPSGLPKSYTFQNLHQLRHIEGYLGGKNGFINASGKTLLTLFELTDRDGEEHIIAIIVLGSEDSTSDSLSLLSWLKQSM